jgi:geranylgeranyl diphosphate synthase type II
MRYAVLGPGKRIRPVLALAAAEAVGGPRRRRAALPYACAIEMIHAYSLVHDDLPAMDDDAMRRGRPTLHVRFGEAMAILAGDALLTEAFAVIGRAKPSASGTAPAAGALGIVAEVASAAGPDGMVAGQVVDLESEGRRGLGLAHVAAIHRRKTGALIRAAVRAGALAASASREELRGLTAYAEALGLAFQIVDDILDETAGIAVTGKKGGGDRAHGKATYPALLGLAGARAAARRAERRARTALAPLGPRAETLDALVQHVVARSA